MSRAGLEVVDDSMHAFPSSPAVIAHDVCGKIRCYNIMQITIIYLCMVGLRSGCLCALCINFSCAVTCLAADQECILVDYYYFVVVSYIYTKYSTVSLFLVAGMNEAMGITMFFVCPIHLLFVGLVAEDTSINMYVLILIIISFHTIE